MELITIVITGFVVFVTYRASSYYRDHKRTGRLPGLRSPFAPFSVLGALLPTSILNPGLNWAWEWRHQVYRHAGTETISSLPYLSGEPMIYTSSLEVARQIVSTKGSTYKREDQTDFITLWGPNLFAANGSEWRRHRRIIAPAFNLATYNSVWNETKRVFDEMIFGEGFSTKSTIDIHSVNKLTNKLALILISTCGFGQQLTWQLNESSANESMPFGEALAIISETHLQRLLLPRWAYKLPIERIQRIERARVSLQLFMDNLIDARRREEISGAPTDDNILSLMIQSNEYEDIQAMTDAELTGNTFLLLSAGHETTSRTLDATLGFLALHTELQEELRLQNVTLGANVG